MNKISISEDSSCKLHGLPEPKIDATNFDLENNADYIENCKTKYNEMYTQLNQDQKKIFSGVTNGTNKLFFINGPGGTGKTFLYKTLIYYFVSSNRKFLSMPGLE